MDLLCRLLEVQAVRRTIRHERTDLRTDREPGFERHLIYKKGGCIEPRTSPAPLRSAFTPRERAIIEAADTPEKVQRWLDSLPYNHEERGETLHTFRGVVRANKVHCLEGALCAATILEQHGYPPVVVDLESQDDLDHVIFLFHRDSQVGSVARSRDPGLHGRKPLFRSVRELVYSYVDPFVDFTGRINGYGILDLRTLRADWRLSTRNVWAVEQALIRMPHRRVRTSDKRYRLWHARYQRYKERYPDRRPKFYPSRHRWL